MNYDQLFETRIIRGLNARDVPMLKDYLIKKKGWVYIAYSKDNDMFKIGRTGKNPLERAITLSPVGVFNDYEIIFALPVFNQFIVESKVHKRLNRFRIKKEFFSVNENTAIEALQKEYEQEKKLLNRFLDIDLINTDINFLENSLRNHG